MFKWLERIFTRKSRSQAPQLQIVTKHSINDDYISENALFVVSQLQNHGFEAYIVGGAVRDLLINIKPKDFDVATNATPEQITRIFKKSRIIGKRFQIVHITFYQRKSHEIIEVTTFRAARNMQSQTQPQSQSQSQSQSSSETNSPNILAKNIEKNIKNTSHLQNNLKNNLQNHQPNRRLKSYGETYPKNLESARQVNETGQLLSDNIWGTQEQDASRRDFTVNAMYYDPQTHEIFDYHNGLDDIRKGCLTIIGDAQERYIEDPVRMLRVARFMAKTGFNIEAQTIAPIAAHAHLLQNIPQARLLDELLKMLTSGFAVACIDHIQELGLADYVLPWQKAMERLEKKTTTNQAHFNYLSAFIHLVLSRTDSRIAQQKSVALGFIFAGVYWPMLWQNWQDALHNKNSDKNQKAPTPAHALELAIDETLKNQQITYRIMDDMREIWGLQVRLEKRTPKNAMSMLAHPRFRAGFDFLELRAISEQNQELFELFHWWEEFQTPEANKEVMLEQVKQTSSKQSKKTEKDDKTDKADHIESAEKSGKSNKAKKTRKAKKIITETLATLEVIDLQVQAIAQNTDHIENAAILNDAPELAPAPSKNKRRRKKPNTGITTNLALAENIIEPTPPILLKNNEIETAANSKDNINAGIPEAIKPKRRRRKKVKSDISDDQNAASTGDL